MTEEDKRTEKEQKSAVISEYLAVGHMPHLISKRTGVRNWTVRKWIRDYQDYEDRLDLPRVEDYVIFHNQVCNKRPNDSSICMQCLRPLQQRAGDMFFKDGVTDVHILAKRLHCSVKQVEQMCDHLEEPFRGLFLTSKGKRYITKTLREEIINLYNNDENVEWSYATLAKVYGLTKNQVQQIIDPRKPRERKKKEDDKRRACNKAAACDQTT